MRRLPLSQRACDLLGLTPVLAFVLLGLWLAGLATVRATALPQIPQPPARYGPDLNPPSVLDLGRGMYCMSFQGGNLSCVYAPDWRR